MEYLDSFPKVFKSSAFVSFCVFAAAFGAHAANAFDARAIAVPAALAVGDAAPRAAHDAATTLKFQDVFKRPAGPRGLELGNAMAALDGKTVEMVGYMVAREAPTPGLFILSPVPVFLGDEDEGFADDLPPSAVFIHLPESLAGESVVNLFGLLRVRGTLRVGAREEGDGRVSAVRIELDRALASLLPLAPHGSALPQTP